MVVVAVNGEDRKFRAAGAPGDVELDGAKKFNTLEAALPRPNQDLSELAMRFSASTPWSNQCANRCR